MVIRGAPKIFVRNPKALRDVFLNPAGLFLGIEIYNRLYSLVRAANLFADLGICDLLRKKQPFAAFLERVPFLFVLFGNRSVICHSSPSKEGLV